VKFTKTFLSGLFVLLLSFSISSFKNQTSKENNLYEIVEFTSENATLRGRLYLPEKTTKLPIVIMAHGFSATIEGMCADRYAEKFYNEGFAVLLYDHRGFGISDGKPRQQTNKWIQARGYRDAIDYVTSLPNIDTSKITLWGDSMSASEVVVVAAIDHRVKGVIAQVPAFGDELPEQDLDGKLFNSIRETLLNGNVEGTPETTYGPMPVVSFDQESVPSMLSEITAYRWFIEYGGRYNTKWVNRVTHVVPNVPTRFNPVICIPHIKAALLLIVSYDDEMKGANSDIARHAYKIAPEPKKIIEVDGGHFGIIHYPSPLFDQASKSQIDFLNEHFK